MAGLAPGHLFSTPQINARSPCPRSPDRPDVAHGRRAFGRSCGKKLDRTMSTATSAFIAGLPKAELHLHIEGTLTQEKRKFFAERNGLPLEAKSFAALSVDAPADGDRTQAAKQKGIAQYKMFLDLYYAGLKVLRTEKDYFDLIFDYLRRCKENNVVYAEISFDPQAHTDRGVAMQAVVEGLVAGREAGAATFGVESNLIMCINRDLPLDSALVMLRDAAPYREHIVGLGLDSVEDGHPPIKFLSAYERARADGYRLTAHCDVDMTDAVKHTWQCLDDLRVERIDHGINVLDDERLIAAVRERNICLTACPTWRNGDPGPRRVDRIRRIYDLGLPVTLNTDDPGYFISGMMNAMLPPVAALGKFSAAELAQFMINAFDAAWLSREKRDGYIARVNSYLAANAPDRVMN
jgi:adenine deaminase